MKGTVQLPVLIGATQPFQNPAWGPACSPSGIAPRSLPLSVNITAAVLLLEFAIGPVLSPGGGAERRQPRPICRPSHLLPAVAHRGAGSSMLRASSNLSGGITTARAVGLSRHARQSVRFDSTPPKVYLPLLRPSNGPASLAFAWDTPCAGPCYRPPLGRQTRMQIQGVKLDPLSSTDIDAISQTLRLRLNRETTILTLQPRQITTPLPILRCNPTVSTARLAVASKEPRTASPLRHSRFDAKHRADCSISGLIWGKRCT